MKVSELARTAWGEIRAHKARSAMTCLSLAAGVAALLFTFSQTGGVMKRYHDALKLAGPGRFEINGKQNYVSKGISPGLTSLDADAIRSEWPELYMVYPYVARYGTRVSLPGFKSENIRVVGTNEDWRKRDWVYRLRGRFLNARDVTEGARVCVLVKAGGWIQKPFWAKYFPDQPISKHMEHHDVLGAQALIEGRLFTVVGILQEPPRDRDPRWFRSGGGGDGLILVPITAFQNALVQKGRGREAVDDIAVDTGDEATGPIYLRRIAGLLASRHREDDVDIKDIREILGGAMTEIRKFIASIMVIGIVAVLASGIGIMNVTLATIFSRVREIGIRRALGARRLDIVAQFVAEATMLGLVGGVGGTALGTAGIFYLAPRAERMAAVGPLYIAASLGIALATGFLFSLYPAYKASRFDPVEALHYE